MYSSLNDNPHHHILSYTALAAKTMSSNEQLENYKDATFALYFVHSTELHQVQYSVTITLAAMRLKHC